MPSLALGPGDADGAEYGAVTDAGGPADRGEDGEIRGVDVSGDE